MRNMISSGYPYWYAYAVSKGMQIQVSGGKSYETKKKEIEEEKRKQEHEKHYSIDAQDPNNLRNKSKEEEKSPLE